MKKFWKENKKPIKFLIFLFVVWQIIISFLTYVLPIIKLPKKETFCYVDINFKNPHFFWPRANFDGIHYLEISQKGYGLYQQAFFPFYPKLIKFLTPYFGGKNLLAALFISNFSFLVGIFLFYKLIRIDFEEKITKNSILFLLLFPTSFFFGMVYTEGLFFLLVVSTFYFARKNKWLLAGIFGALASYTRLVGVFLFPALLWEWWEQKKVQCLKFKVQSLFFVFMIPVGLLSYMKFLAKNYRDPLMFFHVQPFFGAQRSGGKIILLYQVFWRYFKMILTTKLDPLYFTVWLELLIAVGFLWLLYFSYKKGIRLSYLIFSFLAYLTPTLTGTFSSLPRYVLVMFPCFMVLGSIKNTKVKTALLTIFGILFLFSTVLFFKGYWVA